MNRCPHCGVIAAPQMTHCPVCGRFLHEVEAPRPASYPAPKKRIHASQLVANLDRGMWIITLVATAVNLFLNWQDWTREAMWCMYVIVTAFVFHVCIFRPLRLKVFYWLEAVIQVLVCILYPFFVDWMMDGVVGWSITWVMPICFMVIAVTLGIWLSIRRRDAGNLLLMAMSLFIVSLTLWVLGLSYFKHVIDPYTIVPAFAAFLASACVFIFFGALRFRAFLHALTKRFHV